MAVTAKMYGKATLNAFNGTLNDISSASTEIKVMLLSTAYAPNQDTHQSKADITGEVTGTAYVAGGVTLTNKALAYDAGTNTIKFDADDVSWLNSTITARYAVIYDNTPVADADKKLLAYVDFGENKVSSDGTFKILWHTDGIFKVTVA